MHRVKLIAGMLAPEQKLFGKASELLTRDHGIIDYRSRIMPFGYTRYYEEEMGGGLLRQFVSFKRLISPDSLPAAKLRALEVERMFSSSSGTRRINIDPGYVEGAKLVLSTTKNYDHRICLQGEIFAEVTLHYRGGSFIPWEWTYPDYRTEEYIDIFNYIRKIYIDDVKTAESGEKNVGTAGD